MDLKNEQNDSLFFYEGIVSNIKDIQFSNQDDLMLIIEDKVIKIYETKFYKVLTQIICTTGSFQKALFDSHQDVLVM